MSDSGVVAVETVVESDPQGAMPIDSPKAETMSLWMLYLLSVSSLGLFLPFWTYRRARLNGESSEFKSTPGWWGIGVLVAPVACAILYEFSGKAEELVGEDHGWKWKALPSALLACILLVSFLISPGLPLVALFFVLPIPFLLVQGRINSSSKSQIRSVTVKPLQFRARHWLLVVLGFPLVLVLWWTSDLSAYATLLARPLVKDAVVKGHSGSYEITASSKGWKRVRSGTVTGEETDLELVGPSGASWLIVNRWDASGMGLDEVVSFRRSQVFFSGDPVAHSEERYFLEGSDLVPASLALYRVDLFGHEEYIVLTAEFDAGLVEVIGHTVEPGSDSEVVRQIVTSLIEVDPEAGP